MPSFLFLSSRLLARQQAIVDGKTKASAKNVVGVCVQANQETIDSVPYLTHLDFVKGVRELNELCDYVAIDLTSETGSAGIQQFYKNPKALEKLLMQVNTARMVEVGKAAALEYERNGQGAADYSTSVGRVYSRNCLVSTVRPLLVMV